ITNLMSNAMRYTPAGGWVVVSIGYEGRSYMQVSVRDTGIGIAKEDIPRVFSRFWRSDASRERVSGGLGVGLALTKEIIDKHNGSISVESELGKGTTFTLHIPLEHKAGGSSHEE
ncbi:MAG: ATP-binding protein, partial [Parafannyhessea umbonata]|nr:ATP-binding protein [Parafannyhessea umbonata]